MLKVNVESWLVRLRGVRWEGLAIDPPVVVLALKSVVPEALHTRIDAAFSKIENPHGPFHVMVILDGDRVTDEKLVFEMSMGPIDSPNHIHGSSAEADYGEMYWTLAGAIDDVRDEDAGLFTHRPGDTPVRHGADTQHQPHVKSYWIGVFYHPAGSRLAA